MADAEEKKKLKNQRKAEKQAKKEAKKAEKLAAKEVKKADKGQEDEKKTDGGETNQEQTEKIGILTWIILGVVVVIGAGSGFMVGRIFAGSRSQTDPAIEVTSANTKSEKEQSDEPEGEVDGTWFFNMQPVIANLNEPGVTRFVRATITMEISNELEPLKSDDGSEPLSNPLLMSKKPVLENWLTIYLSGLSISDTQGGKNKMKIQLQILDAFNQELFPDSKPLIKKILLKEFVIQ
ncbi:MAG: flagellar basal body-associated FliL family protein [Planctomycetota bacterium]|jgi:flagellar basal body-associated protein FliL